MAKRPPRHSKKNFENLPTESRYSSYHPISRTVPSGVLKDTQKAGGQKKNHFLKTLKTFSVLTFIAVVFLAAWDVRNISSASQKLFGSGNILDLVSLSSAKTDDNGRINLLLVGYSVDDPGHPAASLTDSIILLSMNQASKSGYMLSIPRDLYVQFPDGEYGKINEAYQRGGMEMLTQVVARDFKIQPSYYALFNYAAVRETVNALGGLTVRINSSDPRGLFDPNISPRDGGPLKLTNGTQSLDGQTALNLTRARGDAYGSYGFPQADFDRTQHQRQVLTAIKERLSWKLLLNPIKNQELLDAASNNIKTDVPAGEIRAVFGAFNSIPSSSLKSLSLRNLNGKNYLSSYTTPYGQNALIPSAGLNDYSLINSALAEL